MKRPIIFVLGILVFLAFVYFSYLVHKDVLNQFDFDITVKLQNHIPRRLDAFFSILSLVGSFEVLSIFLVIFLALKRKLLGVFVFGLYFLLHIFEIFGKSFVSHPGPPFLFFRYSIGFLFPSAYVQPGYSYPSGHAGRSAFLSVLFILFALRSKKLSSFQQKMVITAVCLFDVIMFMSRIYLGEHWTSDVIGGALLGISLGLIGTVFL